jgi:hypothetical protein
VPATNSSVIVSAPSRIVVPRSFSSSTSSIVSDAISSGGRNPVVNRRTRSPWRASMADRKIARATLASSLGWMFMPGKRIHRRAPLTSSPTEQHRHQARATPPP